MMQRIASILIALCIRSFIPVSLSAQTLTGVVFDRKNQEPVIGAHVYLDKSSWATVTNVEGRFEVKVNAFVYLPLVVSHVLYQTVTVSNPFTSLPDTIFVDEKENILDDVIVTTGRYSRKQLLRAFHDEFLGNSSGARSCIIENEDKIDIWYNESTHILSASCDEPVRIHNRFLGYRLYLTLSKFEVQYEFQQLGLGESIISIITSTWFEDLAPTNRRIANRRESVFKGSRIHFLRALSTNRLEEEKYWLSISTLKRDTLTFADCFTVIDSLGTKKIIVHERLEMDDKPTYAGRLYFGNLYVNRSSELSEFSSLLFYTNTFEVDALGYMSKHDILFSGYMGSLRIGDALPADYKSPR